MEEQSGNIASAIDTEIGMEILAYVAGQTTTTQGTLPIDVDNIDAKSALSSIQHKETFKPTQQAFESGVRIIFFIASKKIYA